MTEAMDGDEGGCGHCNSAEVLALSQQHVRTAVDYSTAYCLSSPLSEHKT